MEIFSEDKINDLKIKYNNYSKDELINKLIDLELNLEFLRGDYIIQTYDKLRKFVKHNIDNFIIHYENTVGKYSHYLELSNDGKHDLMTLAIRY
jgi:hypothetical protein